ncbi:MAG: hypothetical protein WA432_01380 [Candidatus Babeliaceae bacterium]
MIFQATFWRKFNEVHKEYQYVMVCHDFYNYSNALNYAQINQFEKIIPLCKNVLFIIEAGQSTVEEYRKLNQFSAVQELKELCQKLNHSIQALDLRYKKTRSYYQCLKALNYSEQKQFDELDQRLQKSGWTTKALAQEFFETYDNIYNLIKNAEEKEILTSPFAASLYNTLDSIKNSWNDELQRWQTYEGTLCSYMQTYNCLTQDYLMGVASFDTSLLAIKMFLETMTTQQKLVVICAGHWVSQTIEHFFQNAHCKLLETTGNNFDPNKDRIIIPADIAPYPSKHTQYFIYAEKLQKIDGTEIKPIEPDFFDRFIDPEKYVLQSWWKKLVQFFK